MTGRPRVGNTFALHLSTELNRFVEAQAAESGMSMGNWIRQLIVCAMQVEREKSDAVVSRKAQRHERRRKQ